MSFDTTSLCGVTDYSTHQNHGVINGSPTYDSGVKGQAMSFDGSLGSYRNRKQQFIISILSISTWIKTSTTGRVQGIISQSLLLVHFEMNILFVGIDNKLKSQSHDSSSNQWPTIVHPTSIHYRLDTCCNDAIR